MRKAIPRPIQPTHTVDPLGASKGASKSEGRNMTFRPYSFQLRTIIHCTGWTVKQINFTAVIKWRGTPREPEDLQDLTKRHGKNTVETGTESLA